MMSNYPEGVTGREHQIAGPVYSKTKNVYGTCISCQQESDYEIDIDYYGDGAEVGCFECYSCGYENDYEHYPEFDWSGS